MRGFGQIDPTWALSCIGQGGVPDPQIGCVPAHVYPQVRDCMDSGGTWEPYLQTCIPPGPVGMPPAQSNMAETVARIACAAMSGQWMHASKTCETPSKAVYGIDELQHNALPPMNCPPEAPIPTPMGCQPWPAVPPTPGLPQTPPVQQPPYTTPPVQTPPTTPPAGDKPAQAKTDTSDWVVPAAIVGAAVILTFIATR